MPNTKTPAQIVEALALARQDAVNRVSAITGRRDAIQRERNDWAEAADVLEADVIPNAHVAGQATAALDAEADQTRRQRDRLTAALPLAEQQVAAALAELKAIDLRILPARIEGEKSALLDDLNEAATELPSLLDALTPSVTSALAHKQRLTELEAELRALNGGRSPGWKAWDYVVRDAPRLSSGVSIIEVLLVLDTWRRGGSVLTEQTASASRGVDATLFRIL